MPGAVAIHLCKTAALFPASILVDPRGIEPRYLVLQTSAVEPSLLEIHCFSQFLSASHSWALPSRNLIDLLVLACGRPGQLRTGNWRRVE